MSLERKVLIENHMVKIKPTIYEWWQYIYMIVYFNVIVKKWYIILYFKHDDDKNSNEIYYKYIVQWIPGWNLLDNFGFIKRKGLWL